MVEALPLVVGHWCFSATLKCTFTKRPRTWRTKKSCREDEDRYVRLLMVDYES